MTRESKKTLGKMLLFDDLGALRAAIAAALGFGLFTAFLSEGLGDAGDDSIFIPGRDKLRTIKEMIGSEGEKMREKRETIIFDLNTLGSV